MPYFPASPDQFLPVPVNIELGTEIFLFDPGGQDFVGSNSYDNTTPPAVNPQ
jgi:hypothetical protein